jgi:glycosidase
VSTFANDAVWPVELQEDGVFTCKGRINNWDYDPEFREGDFCDLKDVFHGWQTSSGYVPSKALLALCEAIKFWIGYADLDGLRIDTVKHMSVGASRHFASVIHEFAQSIGKENFYLLGEIAGSREFAFDTMQTTGLDGALGIDGVSPKLEAVSLGYDEPEAYFDLFTNTKAMGVDSHTWFRNTVVTMVDDHDKIGRAKRRFCAEPEGWKAVVNAIALNAMTLGIPCIYYGTEQGFDGDGGDDRALREAMFGGGYDSPTGGYGSLESWQRHFFNEANWIYRAIQNILGVRKNKRALRRGRQYLRKISGNGGDFGYPRKLGDRLESVVAWSRIFASDPEIVVIMNTDRTNPRTAWVTIDADSHVVGKTLACIYAFDPIAASQDKVCPQPAPLQIEARNGKAVLVTLPPAGLAIFEG